MNARYLIVNADDFGLTLAGDGAIAELFAAGRITSTTILAPAKYAAEACRTACEKGLAVGVHWTLHAEWADERWQPCAGEQRARSLCEDGALIPNAGKAGKQAGSGDVTRELAAQVEFLRDRGVAPDHADSHGGTLYGINGRLFFLNAFRLCKKYGLPFRFPHSSAFLRRQFGHEPGGLLRAAHAAIVGAADLYGVPLLDDFITNPYPIVKIDGYAALATYYERELAEARAGITEVFLHPSLPDEALLRRTAEWEKRVWEYEYLRSDAFANFIARERFVLCSWAGAPFDKR
ncbi:MAG: ChbG/HpnK family deacetylase [Clostridiales bacterium]|nr:ChbG/HpnK family deacetylase [Clostridiales bacterium]